jgi:hypothetical protein
VSELGWIQEWILRYKNYAHFILWILFSRRDKASAALFFRHNTQLGPPYQVLVDTNFINFSIRNKVRLLESHGGARHSV